jgi:CO/xanthine dehydrogenase Mo-binding subunit
MGILTGDTDLAPIAPLSAGSNLDPGFLDYKIPSAADVPHIKTVLVEIPAKETLYGASGVGEPPIVATATAVANAVHDAIGAPVTSLPLTPERVLQAIRQKSQG